MAEEEERKRGGEEKEEWKRYRPPEGTTKYFIMKAKTEEQLQNSMDTNTYQPSFTFVREKLLKALGESEQVVIIVSVTGSDCFQAYATIPKDEQNGGDQEPLKTSAWSKQIVKVGFNETDHILNMMFNQNPVTRSKDGQPVDEKAALWIISIIDDKIQDTLPSPLSRSRGARNDTHDIPLEKINNDVRASIASSEGSEGADSVDVQLNVGSKRSLGLKSSDAKDMPPTKLDKFGGTGIIPYDITNIKDYEEYLAKHHQIMVDRYHDFMNRYPNFFN